MRGIFKKNEILGQATPKHWHPLHYNLCPHSHRHQMSMYVLYTGMWEYETYFCHGNPLSFGRRVLWNRNDCVWTWGLCALHSQMLPSLQQEHSHQHVYEHNTGTEWMTINAVESRDLIKTQLTTQHSEEHVISNLSSKTGKHSPDSRQQLLVSRQPTPSGWGTRQ